MSMFAENEPGKQSEVPLPASRSLAARIQEYYRRPDPASLIGLFAECWQAGLFRFPNGQPNPITLTFFAAALDTTGEAGWEGFIDEFLVQGKQPVRRSLWQRMRSKRNSPQERLNALAIIAFLSRDKEQKPFRYFLSRTMPPEGDLSATLAQAEIEFGLMRPKAALDNPLQLDQLWAFFYATGDENAVRKVIAVANGEALVPASELNGPFQREAIMQAAVYSLVELATKQARVCQIIYGALDDYRDAPVYSFLIMALERAGVARISQKPDGTLNIEFELPPEWQ